MYIYKEICCYDNWDDWNENVIESMDSMLELVFLFSSFCFYVIFR